MKNYRVISVGKDIYRVSNGDNEKNVVLTGKMMHNNEYPVVGDYVELNDGNQIVDILPRKTKLSRKIAGKETKEQIIVSNIDYIFIVTSLNSDFNINRLERYLTIVYESGATPVFLLSKSDLVVNYSEQLAELENIAFGVDIYTISSLENIGLDNIKKYLVNEKTIALIGSSGVGKSTLINTLLEKEVSKTSDIRESDDKGKHTTTRREIFKVGDGYIIDTPGMRELQIWSGDLDSTFKDIDEISKNCKFSNCTHTNEPNCAVLEAVKNNEISKDRLENYFKLKKEIVNIKNKQEHGQKYMEREKIKNMTGSLNFRKNMGTKF